MAVCPDGCGHGCCSAEAKCRCQPGWAGARCDIEVATCGPAGGLATQPGLLGEYFNDTSFSSLAFTRIDSVVDFQSGSWLPGLPRVGTGASVRWSGLVQSRTTGWHLFIATDSCSYCGNTFEVFMDHVRLSFPFHASWRPVFLIANQPRHLLVKYRKVSNSTSRLMIQGPNTFPVGALCR